MASVQNYTFLPNADVVSPADSQDGFGMVFRTVIDCKKHPLATSTNYAIAKLPKGFAPRIAAAYVHEKVNNSSMNVVVAIGVDDDEDSIAKTGNLAVYDTGNVAAANIGLAGTVASTVATITQTVITTDANILSFTVSSALSKGVLEITLCGDQLVTPAKVL